MNRTVKSLDDAGVPVEDRQRVLTVASIIQREARFEADMQKVSTVIENRLDPSNQETFGLLQMDSTAQYGYGEMHDGTVSSSAEALADPNPWNTYVNTGPAGRADLQPRRRGDRRGDAPGGRRLALLRHGQPRHRRDGVHHEPRRPQPRRRAVAVLVQ